MHAWIHAHSRVCTCTNAQTAYMYAHICMLAHMDACIHTCMYTIGIAKGGPGRDRPPEYLMCPAA